MNHHNKRPTKGNRGGATPTVTVTLSEEIRALSEKDFNKLFKLAESKLKPDDQERVLLYLMELRFDEKPETSAVKKRKSVRQLVAKISRPATPIKATHYVFPKLKTEDLSQDIRLVELFASVKASVTLLTAG